MTGLPFFCLNYIAGGDAMRVLKLPEMNLDDDKLWLALAIQLFIDLPLKYNHNCIYVGKGGM
jgi:hypothetical protein